MTDGDTIDKVLNLLNVTIFTVGMVIVCYKIGKLREKYSPDPPKKKTPDQSLKIMPRKELH